MFPAHKIYFRTNMAARVAAPMILILVFLPRKFPRSVCFQIHFSLEIKFNTRPWRNNHNRVTHSSFTKRRQFALGLSPSQLKSRELLCSIPRFHAQSNHCIINLVDFINLFNKIIFHIINKQDKITMKIYKKNIFGKER